MSSGGAIVLSILSLSKQRAAGGGTAGRVATLVVLVLSALLLVGGVLDSPLMSWR
jgi:hypothetical protein